jgi:hypothetical protein
MVEIVTYLVWRLILAKSHISMDFENLEIHRALILPSLQAETVLIWGLITGRSMAFRHLQDP